MTNNELDDSQKDEPSPIDVSENDPANVGDYQDDIRYAPDYNVSIEDTKPNALAQKGEPSPPEVLLESNEGAQPVAEDAPAQAENLDELSKNAEDGFLLTISNSVWADKKISIKPKFTENLTNYYKAVSKNIDFSNPKFASSTINHYVKTQTNGLISDLLTENDIDSSTVLIQLNTLYFKADWLYPFTKENTVKNYKFQTGGKIDESTVHVDMMTYENMPISWFYKENVGHLFELPYLDSNNSMWVFLPDTDSEKSIEKKMTLSIDETLKKMGKELSELSNDPVQDQPLLKEINIKMPKFKQKFTSDLDEILKQNMGLGKLFEPSKGYLSNISDNKNIVLNNIKHQAIVQVDEKGTEAAAATAAQIGVTSMPPISTKAKEIVVDRPFTYWIIEQNSNIVLFSGKILDPKDDN